MQKYLIQRDCSLFKVHVLKVACLWCDLELNAQICKYRSGVQAATQNRLLKKVHGYSSTTWKYDSLLQTQPPNINFQE